MPATLEVRRGADRATTPGPGRLSAHSLSFGHHYDPENLSFGPLVAHNDERVEPGHGYDDHTHRDVEILTWVVTGVLTHRDSTGAATRVRAGQVQVQTAGSGVVHSERVEATDPPTRFVQCWLRPSAGDVPPSYAVADVPLRAGWNTLASGLPGSFRVPRLAVAARAYAARLSPAMPLLLPSAPRLHLFLTSGSAVLTGAGERVALDDGDAARLEGAGSARLSGDAEVLLWELG